jgi:hypothetical protein
MEGMMKAKTAWMMVIAATALSLALFAALIENGKAQGSLTLAGKAVKLAYAYASSKEGVFDPKTKDTVVILTDVPLDAKALDDEFVRLDLVRAGKLHGIQVIIDAEKKLISFSILHNALKISYSEASTENAFTPQIFNAKEAAGRVYRKSPGKSFDDIAFTFDVRFHASIK